MNKLFTFLLIFLINLGIKSQTPAFIDDVMFQSFGWDEQNQARVGNEGGFYEFINSRAGNLKAVGYDMIWLPPPSQSTGGVGYIPKEWFNFTETSWGKEAQMDKMLNNLNAFGIFPIADIVVNHRDGTDNCVVFTNPPFLKNGQPDCDAIVGNDESCTGAAYTPCGPAEFGYEGIPYGRDLNHANINVQNAVKEFLTRLKNKGYKGWRWDVAKGFAPEYFGLYIKDSNPYYSVGEYWDGNANTLKWWIDGTNVSAGTSGAFDFGNYYALSPAVRNNSYGGLNSGGRMPGLVNIIGYDSKAVTFVDNHDTFVKDSGILGDHILKAYAYLLTHPGIPCVFAPHYYGGTYSKDGVTRVYTNNQQKINELIAVRKAEQIDAWSNIEIARADGIYAAYIRKRFGDAQPVIAVKIGPGNWDPAGTGWNLATFGTDYAVWTKKTVNTPPIISMTAGEPSPLELHVMW